MCSPCQNSERYRLWAAANQERVQATRTQPSPEAKKRYAKSERGMEASRRKSLRHYHKDVEASRKKNQERYAAKLDRPVYVAMTPEERRLAACAKSLRFREKDRDAFRAAGRKYYADNREKLILKQVSRQKRVREATPLWADHKTIYEIYEQAKSLSVLLGERYDVDHIIPIKGKSVSGLHVHQNLRLMLAIDNRSKSNSFTLTDANA